MDDYISRQEALDELEKLEPIGQNAFRDMLKNLPAANVVEIKSIPCEDCQEFECHGCEYFEKIKRV